jgi:hypothetical protein
LKLRAIGLGSGAGKDDPDFVVYSGEWQIGRIYERKGFPDDVRFFWSLHRRGAIGGYAGRRWRRRRPSSGRAGSGGLSACLPARPFFLCLWAKLEEAY